MKILLWLAAIGAGVLLVLSVLLVISALRHAEPNRISPRYLGHGLTEMTIDDHKYFKSGDILTHSESCPCKKQ